MKIIYYKIYLIDNQQLLYRLIPNPGVKKPEILKIDINTNLANSFIKSFYLLIQVLFLL